MFCHFETCHYGAEDAGEVECSFLMMQMEAYGDLAGASFPTGLRVVQAGNIAECIFCGNIADLQLARSESGHLIFGSYF